MTKHSSFFNQTIRFLMVFISVSALLIIRPEQPARAATFFIVTSADDAGPGTLRQAVIEASSGDTIIFNASLAGSTVTLGSEIALDKDLTIDGSGLNPHIQVSGDDSVRVFAVTEGVTVTIDHLDIHNGYDPMSGGGIDVFSSTLWVYNSTFSGNSADDGGAINVNNATLRVIDSYFVDNNATVYGGAINNNEGSVAISRSTISGNSADTGGGIFNNHGYVAITNSTLSGNSSTSAGGGFLNHGELGNEGTMRVRNTTISGNTSPAGGGIVNGAYSSLLLQNSIVANSPSGGDCVNNGTIGATSTNNLIEDGTCSPDVTGDPLLGPLTNNGGSTHTMALQAGSPAIDAGDHATCQFTDQRGVSRAHGTHCDIGAYESAPQLLVNSLNDPGGGVCDASECTLREVVTVAAGGDTITFDPALAGGTITLGSAITLTKDLTIDGSGLSSHVKISGGGSVRVFKIPEGMTIAVDHLDIRNGYDPMSGGGIEVFSSTLTISNTTFSGNSANDGGAINANHATLFVTNSSFVTNTAAVYGGAINNHRGWVSISDSTIADNTCPTGGGIFNANGYVALTNSTVSGNDGTDVAGGLLNYGDPGDGGVMEIKNSTISGNSSPFGGGIVNGAYSTLHMWNTIVADSLGGADCFNDNNGTIATNINNLIEDGTCSPAVTGDPLLGPLADNGGPTHTMALGDGSPAIDAGDDATCEAVDQRGIARPIDGDVDGTAVCDIGAYEDEPYTVYLPLVVR